MLDHSLTLRDRAFVLRLDHGLSIRAVAQRLGVPRSTVGGWLRGHGECHYTVECRLCESTFFAGSAKARYCSQFCRSKYNAVFGVLA